MALVTTTPLKIFAHEHMYGQDDSLKKSRADDGGRSGGIRRRVVVGCAK